MKELGKGVSRKENHISFFIWLKKKTRKNRKSRHLSGFSLGISNGNGIDGQISAVLCDRAQFLEKIGGTKNIRINHSLFI